MTDFNELEARIKLAEAMGWVRCEPDLRKPGPDGEPRFGPQRWNQPTGKAYGATARSLPNPFTDANDDYAVLEWMRESVKSVDVQSEEWDIYCYFFALVDYIKTRYQIGDYAKALLKVISDE